MQNQWAALGAVHQIVGKKQLSQMLVRTDGIEPSTSALSERRSTTELRAHKEHKGNHWAYPYSLIKFNLLKPSLSNLMFCWGISKSMVKDLFKFFIRNTKLFVINHMVKRRKNTVRE